MCNLSIYYIFPWLELSFLYKFLRWHTKSQYKMHKFLPISSVTTPLPFYLYYTR
uniref:Uncharacterized protein n=1 Tax=Helianthus annuus TaxID=4232 RepID=A0A251TFB5_HELAN